MALQVAGVRKETRETRAVQKFHRHVSRVDWSAGFWGFWNRPQKKRGRVRAHARPCIQNELLSVMKAAMVISLYSSSMEVGAAILGPQIEALDS